MAYFLKPLLYLYLFYLLFVDPNAKEYEWKIYIYKSIRIQGEKAEELNEHERNVDLQWDVTDPNVSRVHLTPQLAMINITKCFYFQLGVQKSFQIVKVKLLEWRFWEIKGNSKPMARKDLDFETQERISHHKIGFQMMVVVIKCLKNLVDSLFLKVKLFIQLFYAQGCLITCLTDYFFPFTLLFSLSWGRLV